MSKDDLDRLKTTRPDGGYQRGDTVVEFTPIAVHEDSGDMLVKCKYGEVKKVEPRTLRVHFEGERKPRRVTVSQVSPYQAQVFHANAKPDVITVEGPDLVRAREERAAAAKAAAEQEEIERNKRESLRRRKKRFTPQKSPITSGRAAPVPEDKPSKPPTERPPAMPTPEKKNPDLRPIAGDGGDLVDDALEALSVWTELGADMKDDLLAKREQIHEEIAERRAQLQKIDFALRVLGVQEASESEVAPKAKIPYSQDEVEELVLSVLAGTAAGLKSRHIVDRVREKDIRMDSQAIHRALSQMHKQGRLGRTGSRGSYVYNLPPAR